MAGFQKRRRHNRIRSWRRRGFRRILERQYDWVKCLNACIEFGVKGLVSGQGIQMREFNRSWSLVFWLGVPIRVRNSRKIYWWEFVLK